VDQNNQISATASGLDVREYGAAPPSQRSALLRNFARYYWLAGSLTLIVAAEPLVSDLSVFAALNILLFAYLAAEIRVERRENPRRWLVSPPVAASIATFFLGCVLPSAALFQEGSNSYTISFQYLGGEERIHWLNKGMECAVLGAAGMWLGYRSNLGRDLSRRLTTARLFRGVLRTDYDVRMPVILTLFFLAALARLLQVTFGVFGYASDIDKLYAYAWATQSLALLARLSRVALLAAALAFFSASRTDLALKTVLISALGLELIFGFLSGFKSDVVYPVVLLAVCQYWFRSRVPAWSLALGLATLFAAYAIVEPFRVARFNDPSFNGQDARSIAAAALAVAREGEGTESLTNRENPVSAFVTGLLDRTNLSAFAAISIKYKTERDGALPENAPRFLFNLLGSPVMGFIPRVIWKGKPLSNIGSWFNAEVVGSASIYNSVGMSPFGYLYFAGGTIAVFLGFFAAGVFQRFVYETLSPAAGGVLVYFALLPGLAVIESAFDSFFAGALQLTLILLVIQRAVLKR
jgi:hypothetical protein